MSVYLEQQRRKRDERWYGEWSATLAAIREARGARESSDVAFEQKLRAIERENEAREAEAGKGMAQSSPETLAALNFGAHMGDITGDPISYGAFVVRLQRLLYGEPIDYTHGPLDE